MKAFQYYGFSALVGAIALFLAVYNHSAWGCLLAGIAPFAVQVTLDKLGLAPTWVAGQS